MHTVNRENAARVNRDGRGPVAAHHPSRALTGEETEHLVRNNNSSHDWTRVVVSDPFDPDCVQDSVFNGRVHLGPLRPHTLETNGVFFRVGIRRSTLQDCTTGADCVIENVGLLAHCAVGDEVILFHVGEVTCSPEPRFGNGAQHDEGERLWIKTANENGGRAIAPFEGMRPADAWLWSRSRENHRLLRRFEAMTDDRLLPETFSRIGDRASVRHCGILRDVRIGRESRVENCLRVEDVTVRSDPETPTQLIDCVTLQHGIVGFGCHVARGVVAERFVIGENVRVENGARLIDSYVGDNSTIACCEVVSALLLPGHQQHHNNSFLIAATILGQSNIAAGVTAGSNHNSRTADGEILAGRGFWPGLCTSLKHNSRFASGTLLAKGAYPAELHITLPFSLVSNNEHNDALLVTPAFWFRHNMYALARASWKFADRDRRCHREQHIEHDLLAPDTAEEMLDACEKIEHWVGVALGKADPADSRNLRLRGREVLDADPTHADALEILAPEMENSRRAVRVLKVGSAWRAYRDMLRLYATRTLLDFWEKLGAKRWKQVAQALGEPIRTKWVNAGGQLAPETEVKALQHSIVAGNIGSWDEVHAAWGALHERYALDKTRHALAVLLEVNQLTSDEMDTLRWKRALETATEIAEHAHRLVEQSRGKDYTNPFRRITFRSEAERDAVAGRFEDDSFLQKSREDLAAFRERVERIIPS